MFEVTEIHQRLPSWAREHVEGYLQTGGEEGHIWRDVTTLLLRTIGRSSKKPLLLPLIYAIHDENYVLVASKGGNANHPAWYLNLLANPDVHIQVGADRFAVRARTAEGEERVLLWKIMEGIWPAYNDYQAATQRTIPVVVLSRQ